MERCPLKFRLADLREGLEELAFWSASLPGTGHLSQAAHAPQCPHIFPVRLPAGPPDIRVCFACSGRREVAEKMGYGMEPPPGGDVPIQDRSGCHEGWVSPIAPIHLQDPLI